MFGEDLIIGHSEGKMDDKNRIIIPSFTKGVPNDRLILSIYEEKMLVVKSYLEILKVINNLRKLQSNTPSLSEYQKYEKEIALICFKLESDLTIDNQKRLLLPKSTLDKFGWTNKDTLLYDGIGSGLLIRKK